MSYSEFPHLDENAKRDLREMIELYNELVGKYTATLDQINAVNSRLDEYIANQDTAFEAWKNNMLTAVDRRVADDIAPLQQKVTDLQRSFEVLQALVDSKNEDIKEYVDMEIGRFELRVSAVEQKITTTISQVNGLREDMNRQIADEVVARNSAIDEAASDINNRTDMIVEQINSRIDGMECASNENRIKWIWDNAIGCCGMSAIAWYNYQPYTCKDWNNDNLSCIQWYIHGTRGTHFNSYIHKMISPISGRFLNKGDIIIEIAKMLKPCGITAGEYDAMEIPAGVYDSKFITAYKYDMCGKGVIRNEFRENT